MKDDAARAGECLAITAGLDESHRSDAAEWLKTWCEGVVPVETAIEAMLAFAQQPVKETVSLDDGFTIDLDDDDFTVCWPDGSWLVAHRSGKITVGKSPFDEALPPKQTTLSAMLDVAPIPQSQEPIV
jgi:hypothetical protein